MAKIFNGCVINLLANVACLSQQKKVKEAVTAKKLKKKEKENTLTDRMVRRKAN